MNADFWTAFLLPLPATQEWREETEEGHLHTSPSSAPFDGASVYRSGGLPACRRVGHPARRIVVRASPSLPRPELPFRAARPACRQAGAVLYGSQDGCRYTRRQTPNTYPMEEREFLWLQPEPNSRNTSSIEHRTSNSQRG